MILWFSVGTTDDTNKMEFVCSWAWKAGGSAVSNTDGSVTSQVSASSEYGFSVVTFSVPGSTPYTGGHGWGSVPKLRMLKSRTGNNTNWNVYHDSTGNQSRSYLNLTLAASTGSNAFNSTSPTSDVFSMGSSGEFSGDMVAYCWSEVSGFSKFGSYSGSSSSDVTVTTGFKPRFILIKCSDTDGQEWVIKDNVRGGDKYLHANDNSAEATGRDVTLILMDLPLHIRKVQQTLTVVLMYTQPLVIAPVTTSRQTI